MPAIILRYHPVTESAFYGFRECELRAEALWNEGAQGGIEPPTLAFW